MSVLRDVFGVQEAPLISAGTYQNTAVNWMVQEFQKQGLDFDKINPTTLLERYALAAFYYATNGDDWDDDYNFLTEASVCDWNFGLVKDWKGRTIIDGVSCNLDGNVTQSHSKWMVLPIGMGI